MRYFKNEPNGDVCLYVVDDGHETISQLKWDESDNIEYNWNYGYSNLSTVENYTQIEEGDYITWTDALNSSARIGTHPTRPPGS